MGVSLVIWYSTVCSPMARLLVVESCWMRIFIFLLSEGLITLVKVRVYWREKLVSLTVLLIIVEEVEGEVERLGEEKGRVIRMKVGYEREEMLSKERERV